MPNLCVTTMDLVGSRSFLQDENAGSRVVMSGGSCVASASPYPTLTGLLTSASTPTSFRDSNHGWDLASEVVGLEKSPEIAPVSSLLDPSPDDDDDALMPNLILQDHVMSSTAFTSHQGGSSQRLQNPSVSSLSRSSLDIVNEIISTFGETRDGAALQGDTMRPTVSSCDSFGMGEEERISVSDILGEDLLRVDSSILMEQQPTQ